MASLLRQHLKRDELVKHPVHNMSAFMSSMVVYTTSTNKDSLPCPHNSWRLAMLPRGPCEYDAWWGYDLIVLS